MTTTSARARAAESGPPEAVRRRTSSLPLAAGAFLRKEALDVLRQPRLLLTLVVGPFLILLAFGLGYRNDVRPFRTVFVGDPDAALTREVQASADRLGPLVEVEAVVDREDDARRRLADGEVDAVVILPDDPLSTVLDGRRAVLRILHTRLDPVELTIIGFASRLAVAEVNATVLASLISEGQTTGLPVSDVLAGASEAVDAVVASVDAGDLPRAEQELGRLDSALTRLDLAATSASALAESTPPSDELSEAADALRRAVENAGAAVDTARSQLASGQTPEAKAELARAQQILRDAPAVASQLLDVDASVLVQPFVGEVSSTSPGRRTFTDYYAPAAIVLLLQQFGVAFAALSFVRERQLGASELYRVAPVGPGQVVIGKYLGHLLIGGIVAAVLTALVTVVLGVPLVGDLGSLIVSLGLVVLASVGLGFLISLTSRSDMQAVLSTMLVLLASLFFSGFFLSVRQLALPAKVISWALPATYGIEQARDVMLRGDPLEPATTLALATYSLVAGVFVFALSSRRMTALT